nr:unnamed protein product [Callosobruchus analis]
MAEKKYLAFPMPLSSLHLLFNFSTCFEEQFVTRCFKLPGNPKADDILKDEVDILKELTNNSQTQSSQEKIDSPVNFEGNTSAQLGENASELEFIEDSDDPVNDANYANQCLSSTESSSSCSTCSSDFKSPEIRYDAENRKDTSKVRGRKRKLGPEKWKKNLAKKLRNIGEAYTNTKNIKAYSKRELQPPCDEKNTLCINDRLIRTVLSKRDLNHPQFVQEDLRGKHRNHHKLDEEIKDSIRRHIDSVPRIPSHYSRANTSREFIEGGLTVADLHRAYTKLRQKVQQPAGNYVLYHKIFNEQYNISFFTPKKDQCELCVSYQNAGEFDKATMKANFEKHLTQKEL